MIDVWVTGSSLTALDAALTLAEVGLRVRVSLGDAATELPLGPQRDPAGAIAAMVARVGAPLPGDQTGRNDLPKLREYAPTPVLLRGIDGELHPLSETAVCGVPTAPLTAEVIALLGNGGAFRAYMDRLRPVLNIGKEQNLGALVRSRLGTKAVRILVNPFARERAGAPVADVDAAMLVPGLNEALSRVGSLTGAALSYGDRNVARETTFEPEGGWSALRAALLTRLALYAVDFVEDCPVVALGLLVDDGGVDVRTGPPHAPVNERVRAVILDVGGLPRHTDALGFADDPALSAPDVRQYAEIGIEEPAWLVAANGAAPLPALVELPASTPASASTSASTAAPTSTAGSSAESGSTVRSAATAASLAVSRETGAQSGDGAGWTLRVLPRGDGWVARFSGPRRALSAQGSPSSASALCAAAQVTPLQGDAGSWVDRLAVASVISVETDHARLRAIVDFDAAHPGLRPVGDAWAGGSLAAAIAEAMPRVIELRRHLLGIA